LYEKHSTVSKCGSCSKKWMRKMKKKGDKKGEEGKEKTRKVKER
jgi:hypothetical protein